MLLREPVYYYSLIREKFRNSYLAEDSRQVIIGIDCSYIDSYEYSYKSLEQFYNLKKSIKNAPFAGLFGVFSYETVHFFEKIDKASNKQFSFPEFILADAKAYLHYSKISKEFSFYGDEKKYSPLLENEMDLTKKEDILSNSNKDKTFYHINTDLEEERRHFYNMV